MRLTARADSPRTILPAVHISEVTDIGIPVRNAVAAPSHPAPRETSGTLAVKANSSPRPQRCSAASAHGPISSRRSPRGAAAEHLADLVARPSVLILVGDPPTCAS